MTEPIDSMWEAVQQIYHDKGYVVLGSMQEVPIGHIVTQVFEGHLAQPFMVMERTTAEEYYEQLAKLPGDHVPKMIFKYFYRVVTE
jgi:hypothetical protein